MQPLKLRIDGLHSFRDAVEIDLAELGQHGLFGVFGPTGSGKSTLLDALTLALYGQVDRLSGRSRKGIVNHHCKKCEVRLDFRCGEQEWAVQRAYRKGKEGAAVRIHSRLLREGTAGTEVIADKEREVNSRIEELLGLNAQDFMRAVVLPQGRFMQFLHLQGSERRRMLQRLFHLEAYGEELRARVKREASEVDRSLQHVLGELAGLGPAGAGDLKTTRQEVAAAKQQRENTARALLQATEALEQATERWNHQRALQSARGALQDHLDRGVEVEATRQAIHLARRARPVLGALRTAEEAEAEQERQRQTTEALGERLEKVRADEAHLQEAWQRAAEERSREEPGLETRRDALQRAVALEEELARITDTSSQAERRRSQLAKRQQADEQKLLQLERELRELVAEKTRLSGLVMDHNVSQDLREQLTRAQEYRRTLEAARERAAELKRSLNATRERRSEAQGAEARAYEAVKAAETRLRRTREWASSLRANQLAMEGLVQTAASLRNDGIVARLAELEERWTRADAEHARYREQRERAQQALEALSTEGIRGRLAGVLAGDLDGPCPVCGSEEHPHPAPIVSAEVLEHIVQEQAQVRARLGVATASEQKAANERKHIETSRAALRARVPTTIGNPAAFLDRERRARTALERAVERATHSERAMAPNLEDARQLLAAASAQRGSLVDQETREQAELDSAVQTEGTAWGALQHELGELTLFDLPRLRDEIRRKDRRREELQPKLDHADTSLRKANERYTGRRTRVVEQGAELDQVAREAVQLADRKAELLTALRARVPEGSAAQQAREVSDRLKSLAKAVNTCHQELEGVRRTLLQVTAERSSALGRLQGAESASNQARTAADAAMRTHGFDEAPDPASALPEVDLEARETEVLSWQTHRAALELAWQRLAATELEPIEDGLLQQRREQRLEAATEDAEANDALVLATERLEQLERRAERYRDLAEQRATLSERASRLSDLSRLLRGDRFVEYVANDYLSDLVADATEHLGLLTRGRYALDLDEQGGFLVADLDAGGALRPAHSLSGGETFLTSLALALSLSTQVQHHNAQALDFFFLDEGFGSLDPDALDRVMTAIEALSSEHRIIGLISHVDAVKERVPRYLDLRNPRDATGTAVTYREA